ncbi:dihydroorotate dehydrogenase electron transfer subunit [Listeria costaricensis]|uniref:dihydroorotate dehydrogenase electron transfer subunit n=1 Tax=Listeria costaricensis TaxID=2026604 RepID=UPI000C071591|nr:dihydroorotate dehydrogenase electron transfer subunit [Listeria costaricensis]
MQTNMEVVSQKIIADQIYELKLKGENVRSMSAGQFLMIRPTRADLLLRRPISLCQIDRETETATLLYRAMGEGTKSLTRLEAGMTADVVGPLGHGFDLTLIESGRPYLLVGGGIGVPPLYELGRQIQARGGIVTFVNGFASQKDVFYEAEMKQIGTVHITTEDGSYGTKGYVTDVTQYLSFDPALIFSCGPHPMLTAIKQAYPATRTYLSLEERMACGLGACYACVCEKNTPETGHLKVCQDGPVFRADEVRL